MRSIFVIADRPNERVMPSRGSQHHAIREKNRGMSLPTSLTERDIMASLRKVFTNGILPLIGILFLIGAAGKSAQMGLHT